MRNALCSLLVVAIFLGCVNASGTPQATASTQKQTSASQSAAAQQRKLGEQKFQANCGRCHNPPESLSPREVKAVLQHMRVRAMLSAEDEKLIRKYLAP
jgi:cytochrome c5